MIEQAVNFYYRVQGLTQAGYEIHFKQYPGGQVGCALVAPGGVFNESTPWHTWSEGGAAAALSVAANIHGLEGN